jgi:hypothetical protein
MTSSAAGIDDLDLRRVAVDWNQHDASSGSFGVVFSGTWRDDSGVECDVVVKVSSRTPRNSVDDDVSNETLR